MMKYKIKDPSPVGKFRKSWEKKGYELINISRLCEVSMGESGSFNDFDEPDETCHFVRVMYRNENIGNLTPAGLIIIDDEKYCAFVDEVYDGDFAIFRKVKV